MATGKTTKKKSKKETERITCSICGKSKAKNAINFYKSNLQEYSLYDGFCSTCKECLQKYTVDTKANTVTIESVRNVLQKLNKPVVEDLFIEVSNLGIENKKILGEYVKRLNTYCSGKYKDKQFEDSIDIKIESDNKMREKQIQKEDREVTDEMLMSWGRGLSDEDYFYLDDKFNAYTKHEKNMDSSKEDNYRSLCAYELQRNKLRFDVSSIKDVKTLQDMINQLKFNLGIQDIQKQEELGNEKLVLGLITRHIEDNLKRPIPRYVEDLGGEDKIHEFAVEFIGGMAQSLNTKNPMQKEYDEMMKDSIVTKEELEMAKGLNDYDEDE